MHPHMSLKCPCGFLIFKLHTVLFALVFVLCTMSKFSLPRPTNCKYDSTYATNFCLSLDLRLTRTCVNGEWGQSNILDCLSDKGLSTVLQHVREFTTFFVYPCGTRPGTIPPMIFVTAYHFSVA